MLYIKVFNLYAYIKTFLKLFFLKMFFNIKTTGYQVFHSGFSIRSNSNKIKIKLGNIRARKNFLIQMEKSANLIIGDGVFFNNNCSINILEEVIIGENTIFGENIKIYDHNHNYKLSDILIKDQGFTTKKINIGKNCWIGSNVVILKGVSIGDNVIIGANCLIHKDIPSNHKIINNTKNQIIKGLI